MWSHSGRELFFVDEGLRMVAAQVATEDGFAVTDRNVLFPIPPDIVALDEPQAGKYDVSLDDQKFLMIRDLAAGGAATERQWVLVTNFLEELERRISN